MFKRTIFVLLLASLAGSSLFAQKFTKRELARREAREAYYFCGATFTFSAAEPAMIFSAISSVSRGRKYS